jgi:hypothetical protein
VRPASVSGAFEPFEREPGPREDKLFDELQIRIFVMCAGH